MQGAVLPQGQGVPTGRGFHRLFDANGLAHSMTLHVKPLLDNTLRLPMRGYTAGLTGPFTRKTAAATHSHTVLSPHPPAGLPPRAVIARAAIGPCQRPTTQLANTRVSTMVCTCAHVYGHPSNTRLWLYVILQHEKTVYLYTTVICMMHRWLRCTTSRRSTTSNWARRDAATQGSGAW